MKIAVTYEKGEVFQHFGHTEWFKLYETDGTAVVSSKVVSSNGQGHGALATLLSDYEVDTLICGGIGGGARLALFSAGIDLYAGITGSADEAVSKLISGELPKNSEANCDHHHEDGHDCHDHDCGHDCH